MPLNDEQIEQAIERILASQPDLLFGARANSPRNAAGDRVFAAMADLVATDTHAAGEEEPTRDGLAS